jgi:predicted nucleic acid-binding protein
MILVDTSIWIEFLRQNQDFTGEMFQLLKNRQVLAIEPVFSELIYGARNEKEKNIIYSYWKLLPKALFTAGSMLSAAEYINNNNMHTSGIGLIDAVIMLSVMQNDHRLWTRNKRILKGIGRDYLYK